jgi:ribonuclease HI
LPAIPLNGGDQIFVCTDGACDLWTRIGGWGAILWNPTFPAPVRLSGALPRTTNNRAELTAVISALQRLPPGTRVWLRTDSRSVADGINEYLDAWKLQGWRAGTGRHRRDLKNLDLRVAPPYDEN